MSIEADNPIPPAERREEDDPDARAIELLRVADLTDRLAIVDRDRNRNGLRLAGAWAVVAISVGVGLFVNPLGFLGILTVAQVLFPLLRKRHRLNEAREKLLAEWRGM